MSAAEEFVAAGRLAGGVIVEFRRSPYCSVLDDRDPANPKIILHPDEPADVLAVELVDQARRLVERARAQQAPHLALAHTTPEAEVVPVVNPGRPHLALVRNNTTEAEVTA